MKSLKDFLPEARTLIDLEPEELGGIMLQVVASRPGPFHLGNFENELFSSPAPLYPYETRENVEVALREAFAWLEGQALLIWSDSSNGPHGGRMLSRRGKQLANSVAWKEYRQATLLPKELLHPTIFEKTYFSFIRGEYDTAVFQAFKEVEVRVRNASNLSNDIYGVTLMRKAFGSNGLLKDPRAEGSEQEALAHLFSGAVGLYKNPTSHREVELSSSEAIEMIFLASHLLKIVDSRHKNA